MTEVKQTPSNYASVLALPLRACMGAISPKRVIGSWTSGSIIIDHLPVTVSGIKYAMLMLLVLGEISSSYRPYWNPNGLWTQMGWWHCFNTNEGPGLSG